MTQTDQITLNLMDDIWTTLHLSPEAVVMSTGDNRTGILLVATDADDPQLVYYIDNGRNSLPDGVGLRARFGALDGPTVFTATNHTGEPVSWQQKGVEPLLVAIRTHMADVRASDNGHTPPKSPSGGDMADVRAAAA